jgi:glutaredoxin 3
MVSLTALILAAAMTPILAWAPAPVRYAVRGQPLARASVKMDFFNDMKLGLAKLQAGQYDEAQIKQTLDRQIKQKPCIMYSLSSCPFCKDTKKILSGLGTMYTIVECDQDEDGMPLKAELAARIGRTSLPAVFAGGEFLGGCNDGGMGGVATLQKQGKLTEVLIKAGALSPTQRI